MCTLSFPFTKMETYIAFALSTPFLLLIMVRDYINDNYISPIGIMYFLLGLLAIRMWIKDYKKSKVNKKHWKDIKQQINWI